MASTNPQPWARVCGVAGMHLPGLQQGVWYRVVEAPSDAAAHMRDDIWLEVDGRVQRFGRSARLELKEGMNLPHDPPPVPLSD